MNDSIKSEPIHIVYICAYLKSRMVQSSSWILNNSFIEFTNSCIIYIFLTFLIPLIDLVKVIKRIGNPFKFLLLAKCEINISGASLSQLLICTRSVIAVATFFKIPFKKKEITHKLQYVMLLPSTGQFLINSWVFFA